MVQKSQDELEAPAKMYQLIALETKVDGAIEILKSIQDNTKGVATIGYVNQEIKDTKTELKAYADTEIAEAVVVIHAKYEPMQKEHDWVKYGVIGSIGVQLLLGGLLYLLSRGI